jgi:hypothetical protein
LATALLRARERSDGSGQKPVEDGTFGDAMPTGPPELRRHPGVRVDAESQVLLRLAKHRVVLGGLLRILGMFLRCPRRDGATIALHLGKLDRHAFAGIEIERVVGVEWWERHRRPRAGPRHRADQELVQRPGYGEEDEAEWLEAPGEGFQCTSDLPRADSPSVR